MAQSPRSSDSPANLRSRAEPPRGSTRDPSAGEGAFVLLMAIVPTTFIVILVGILALNP